MDHGEYNNMDGPPSASANSGELPTTVNSSPQQVSHWKSYFTSKDFFEIIGSITFGIIAFLISRYAVALRKRPIPVQALESGEYVRNLNYDEVFKHETISNTLLILLSFVIPFLVIIILAKLRGRWGEIHATICTYSVAFGLNALFTNVAKNYVGYLRPIFFNYCSPDDNYEACTGKSDSVRVSFPSGHASQSFCGLVLLMLYLETTFGLSSVRVWRRVTGHNGTTELVVDYKKEPAVHRAISVLSLTPVFVAWFVAISRVHDNKHFPADVIGGTVIGVLVAVFTFRLWFPVMHKPTD